VPPASVLQLDGALSGLYVDVLSFFGNDSDAARGAQDSNSGIGGQLVLGPHFALSLTHRDVHLCDVCHSANRAAS